MYEQTMNNDLTMTGGGDKPLLAGRYQVVRQLGTGGMGSVWLAEDTQLDNKQFAIKMLPSILVSNKRAYRQLKDEALVAMKLVHPNIVQLRAFEENNGNPFLVMDYIDGQTLDDYLAEKEKLSEDETIKLLKPIAAALDYAHDKGVVHRDVKPGNVMIAQDGTPFILDFGIAREIQETMTRVTGKLSSGTLLYMSPEQLNGEKPTPAQDIYSFAAMTYECLKGEPPFVRGAIDDQIKNKVPEPPEGASATFARSIMSGLAKKPENRPPTCLDVLSGNLLTQRRKDAEKQRGRAWTQIFPNGSKSRLGETLGVLALFAALAGGAYYGMTKHDEGVLARRKERAAIWEAERKASEERMAKLKAERETAEAEKRKIEQERQKTEEGNRWHEVEEKAKAEGTHEKCGASIVSESDIIEISVEASVQKGRVERIDDADCFKALKNDLADELAAAVAYSKVKQWDRAAAAFTNYVNAAKSLVELDGERNAAALRLSQAERERQVAKDAGAEQYAEIRWTAANDLFGEGRDLMAKMRFGTAKDKFALAEEQYKLAAEKAEKEAAERERLKREAEKKKKKREAERMRQAQIRRNGNWSTMLDYMAQMELQLPNKYESAWLQEVIELESQYISAQIDNGNLNEAQCTEGVRRAFDMWVDGQYREACNVLSTMK